ncbi:MAG: Adenosylcobinamide amidohydrolase [Candidatus Syntrophoarchaeum sp. GoM_oil]|nr:MAG: Adenosylcobinamide amidohydrolase [Candidatus Syntrophoarchaeum sp. GoM_oil]
MWEIGLQDDALVVSSGERFRVLSSAVFNGGYQEISAIVNIHVGLDYDHEDPIRDLINRIKKMGFDPDDAIGMMTAVDMENAVIEEGKDLTAVITGGLTNPATADFGTINIIILTKGYMTEPAMANAIITATEAKTAALIDLDARVGGINGTSFVTGTTTDSVAIASFGREGADVIEYAGLATQVGSEIGRLVRCGVKRAIELQDGTVVKRKVIDRLSERGIYLDDMAEVGMALYIGNDFGSVKEKLISGIEHALKDVNVESLIIAAMRLEEEADSGRLYGLNDPDPVYLVADELIGIGIAEYIAGSRGLFNFTRYDQQKPGILSTLGPYLDDAIGGLVAGVMSDIFNREEVCFDDE